MLTSARSRFGLNGICAMEYGAIATAPWLLRPSVYPSGGAFATMSMPSTPPAPALFSTNTVCPSSRESAAANGRPKMSEGPPGGKPITSFTGLEG